MGGCCMSIIRRNPGRLLRRHMWEMALNQFRHSLEGVDNEIKHNHATQQVWGGLKDSAPRTLIFPEVVGELRK